MSKRYRLLARAQIDGAIRDPGYEFMLEDGVRGPHRTALASDHGANHTGIPGTLLDIPLYVEVDEGLTAEREEMRARHAQELADLNKDAERDALLAKHAEEASELGARTAEREMQLRHDQEAATLKARQEQEVKAFEAREPVVTVAPPVETNEEDLRKRHDAEAKALADKQAIEKGEVLPVAEPAPPAPPVVHTAPSAADPGFNTGAPARAPAGAPNPT